MKPLILGDTHLGSQEELRDKILDKDIPLYVLLGDFETEMVQN